jgi:hypothetical protein
LKAIDDEAPLRPVPVPGTGMIVEITKSFSISTD